MFRSLIAVFFVVCCMTTTSIAGPLQTWGKLVIGWKGDNGYTTEPITQKPLKPPTVNDFVGWLSTKYKVNVRVVDSNTLEIIAGDETYILVTKRARTRMVATVYQSKIKGKTKCFDVDDCSTWAARAVGETVRHARNAIMDHGWSDTLPQLWAHYIIAYYKGDRLASEPYGPNKYPIMQDFVSYKGKEDAKYRLKFKKQGSSVLKIRLRSTYGPRQVEEIHLRHVAIPNGPNLVVAVVWNELDPDAGRFSSLKNSTKKRLSQKKIDRRWKSNIKWISRKLAEKTKPKPVILKEVPKDWLELKIATPVRQSDKTIGWFFKQKIPNCSDLTFNPGAKMLIANCQYGDRNYMRRGWKFYFIKKGSHAYLQRVDSAGTPLTGQYADRAYNDILEKID